MNEHIYYCERLNKIEVRRFRRGEWGIVRDCGGYCEGFCIYVLIGVL